MSVAIATYNGEKFLLEQLESIQSQTVLPTEIVISDDNSCDDTLRIVSMVLDPDWCEKSGVTLKVRHNRVSLGPGPNFEQAIKACSGDFIVLADQDDRWHRNKVEVLIRAFADHPGALLVHSDADLVDASGQALGMKLSDGIGFGLDERAALASGHSLPAFIKRNLATGATTMFRRELVEWAFPLPESELHDGWLALAASLVDGVVFIPEALIDYRQHGSNQVGGAPLRWAEKLERILGSHRVLQQGLWRKNRDIESLTDRLGPRVSVLNRQIVLDRLAHNQWRIGLPSSRFLRVWPVLWGFLRGRYRQFGRQPHDVLRDVVMPPEEHLLRFLRRIAKNPGK